MVAHLKSGQKCNTKNYLATFTKIQSKFSYTLCTKQYILWESKGP